MALYCAGRMGATAELGLENCGLETDNRGRLAIDTKTFQTSVPHIYAAGDVIGFPSLDSTSMEQGRIAACHAFGLPVPPRRNISPTASMPFPKFRPRASASSQRAGSARERHILRMRHRPSAQDSRGHIMGLDQGLMKMFFSNKTRRLLGGHIIGEGATELIHFGQAVLNLKGTIDYFIENTFNYPTLAEAYKIAALDAWNRM